MAGDSMLSIAQQMSLTEKQVQQYMEEALSVQTDLMKNNAELFQQFFFLQHQEMYRIARQMCLGRRFLEGGEEITDLKADLYWFREMRAQLVEMQKYVEKYLASGGEEKSINITILEASDFYEFAASLRGYKDVNLLTGS